MKFSVILPCFNEEAVIAKTVRNVASWMAYEHLQGEIIVVDDGSRDGSLEVLQDLHVSIPILRVVRHLKNQGVGAALRTGFDSAKMDIVGFMDSDGQFKAEDFNVLIAELYHADFVSGIRRDRSDPFHRKLYSFLWNILVRLLLRIRAKDVDCGIKLFRRSIWSSIRPEHSRGALFFSEMFFRAQKNHIPYRQVFVRHLPRVHGKATGAKPRVVICAFLELGRLLTSKAV